MSEEPKRYRINWRESRRLRERVIPLYSDYHGNVAAYLSDVIELAGDVLVDMGINPKVPLDIDDRLKYIDTEKKEESADGYVAVHLLEGATIVRDLLNIEMPTSDQLQLAVRLMAEIADLLHMADSNSVLRLLSYSDNEERNKEIYRRRVNGESYKTIRKEMGIELSDQQLYRIVLKLKPS